MMFKRILELPRDYSFFLFGARGTGKSTLLTDIFAPHNTIFINLLNPREEIRFLKSPEELRLMKSRKCQNCWMLCISF